MGEIADMMINGDLCECCGEALMSDETPGHPMYCSVGCATDRGVDKEDWPYVIDGYDL